MSERKIDPLIPALIERLEALAGPDREIDWLIHRIDMGAWLDEHGYKRVGDGYVTETPPIHGTERCSGPEYFTASLDCTVALIERVLPGCEWTASNNARFRDKGPFAEIVIVRPAGKSGYCGLGKTAPLAILIAMLKAKEAGGLVLLPGCRSAPSISRALEYPKQAP